MYGKKQGVNRNKTMTMRCKVCNTSKSVKIDQTNSNVNWECQTCGNLLDVNGNVITLK